MPSHDTVCMYHHLSGHPATRAFGTLVLVFVRCCKGHLQKRCRWSETHGLSCNHWIRPSMQIMRCSGWLVMLTDTGHQVSLQLGTGSDAFPGGVAFSGQVIVCRNDDKVQDTVVDNESMHARRCNCICAETIGYGSRNARVFHRGDRRTMNSPRKLEIRTPQY
jgi:hypothetical protein